MNRIRLLLLSLLVIVPLTATLIHCGNSDSESSDSESSDTSSSSASSSGGGCAWHGNCSSTAPNGAYDCSGNSIYQCMNGSWEYVVGCGSLQNSDGYFCTCKGGCGTDSVACSYAFKLCGGQSYATCGPNADAVITDSWRCQ